MSSRLLQSAQSLHEHLRIAHEGRAILSIDLLMRRQSAGGTTSPMASWMRWIVAEERWKGHRNKLEAMALLIEQRDEARRG
jgi:hypothetical protein